MNDSSRLDQTESMVDLTQSQATQTIPELMPENPAANALLALNLRVARQMARLTQADAAKALGRSRQTVVAWENPNATAKPDHSMLEEIGKLYRQRPDMLTEGRLGIRDKLPDPLPFDHSEKEEFLDRMRRSFPPSLEIMAMDFEDELRDSGVDREFRRYVRGVMHDPALMILYAGGVDTKPLTVAEQEEEFAALIDALRGLLHRRLKPIVKQGRGKPVIAEPTKEEVAPTPRKRAAGQ